MIQRSDILSIPFLKKSAFTGSYLGMRYRLEKWKSKETESLRVAVWCGPYNYDVTEECKKEYGEFPFSEEGIQGAVEWLNRKWEKEKEKWQKAQNNW